MDAREQLIVIGNGMVGARVVEEILARDRDRFRITMFGAEPYGNYNRILLSNVLNGAQHEREIFLNPIDWYDRNGVRLHAGVQVDGVDRVRRVVTAGEIEESFDRLIFATGSRPFVPPLEGLDKAGVFLFRTLDDCREIAAYAARCTTAAVLGGGLLGLEAARGLLTHGVEVSIVEVAPHLMVQQLDPAGGEMLRRTMAEMGVRSLLNRRTSGLTGNGRVTGIRFADGETLDVDMVVISCGIRANSELARDCGLEVERGIVVDDQLRTADPAIFAVGECAQHRGTVYGLVAPLYDQARVLADRITGADPAAAYDGSKLATKLKVMGVDLVSMGRVADLREGDEVVEYHEAAQGIYKKLIVRDGKVAAGCLLGDTDNSGTLMDLFVRDAAAPDRRATLLFPSHEDGAPDVENIPNAALICSCQHVSKETILASIGKGCCSINTLAGDTRAGTGCGGCMPLLQDLLAAFAANVEQDPRDSWYVPGVPLAKSKLIEQIRLRGLKSVSAVFDALAGGDVDAGSKMGLASLLRSIWHEEYVDERDARFINDRVHANIQRDGTFSVVPRIFGGVTTPDQLRRIADAAEKYDVKMVKITGGQRIDLLGVRKEDLPAIWRDLDMPSGHAYTKAFRTCKTCVGTDFCRFGIGDSTTLGMELEKRFQGLEFPHKLKLAASGCPRNCAEATVKDIGFVAVDEGWEIYVGGAAGSRVRAGDLLCKVGTHDDAIRYAGRFMQYYREQGKWMERSHAFVERIGAARLRELLIDDVEGLGESLDAEIQKAIDAFVDPWLEADAPYHPAQFAREIEPAGVGTGR